MPDTNSQATQDTNTPELRLNRLEAAWRTGDTVPDWRKHLPTDNELCSPQLIFDLLQMDIEYRIKAGLPALLAERYFEHPRLQRPDARLDDVQQVELIQWEYLQRLTQGQRPRRAEYEAAFPRHAESLHEMKPRSRCPSCQKILILEETFQTLLCPDCGIESHLLVASPRFVRETTVPAELDPRGYQLIETLGTGGMGEVYRCCDPALGRDLAIKVMKAEFLGVVEAERRFLREARVTGSLQHPGIVPVHNLGRLTDGRLHYTMRLVRGETFAAILGKEAGKPERLPYLLSIFEKVCQAVAYAHSKHVIHRDLKPHNVMVGRFGEVQVMDWGLAKMLAAEDAAEASEAALEIEGTRIHTEAADTPLDQTQMGRGMGTVAYMSSEQALGEWDKVDERADVFALGSILCQILTGQPAYSGADGGEVYRRAKRGDVSEALQRLQQCGADAALIALCRECLSLHREDRPRDADIVAKHLAMYQAEVQERLRRAELERMAAEIRAREEKARAIVEQERVQEALARAKAERRAKWQMMSLAIAIIVFLVVGGGGYWWEQRKQEQLDKAAMIEHEERERAEEERRRADEAKHVAEMSRDARKRFSELIIEMGEHLYELDRAIPLVPKENARLVIGLAGRSRVAVQEAFEAYGSLRKNNYRSQRKDFELRFVEYKIEDLLKGFREPTGKNQFDVLLIDDPWLPALHEHLIVMDKVKRFEKYFKDHPPLTAFVDSLQQVCVYKDRLYGLPLIGNVQLLLYRKDLLASAGLTFPGEDQKDEAGLIALSQLCKSARARGIKNPFAIRYTDENSIVEQFWQILQCYANSKEQVEEGRVIVSRERAITACQWLQEIDTEGRTARFDDRYVVDQLLTEDNPRMLLAFGWPSWVIRPFIEGKVKAHLSKNIGFQSISSKPLMGNWLLVIPSHSLYPEEALKAVITLTNSSELQLYLARSGAVPVLKALPEADLKNIPVLSDGDNYTIFRKALQQSKPRPRTPNWLNVEAELGGFLLHGQLPRNSDHVRLVK